MRPSDFDMKHGNRTACFPGYMLDVPSSFIQRIAARLNVAPLEWRVLSSRLTAAFSVEQHVCQLMHERFRD
jgi:hypothetical protein